jgi:alkanesulfonate monooxygenase SsuD/methylene tetrahydromethanopterin reductase-like flavin-dependent oxidoreductase (luciferase family)
MMPLHPPQKDRTQCFEEDIELVRRADELGFTEAWIGQHHTVAWEPIPANDLFIGHLIPQTRNIRLGTGVSILPQHHPANVAVRLAFLDHLSKGRLNCGFGQGGVPTDHELFNLPDPKTQGLMTVEAIDLILRLWEVEAPFDFQGKYWRVRIQSPIPELGVGVLLKPYQKPHPPIGMSVIRGSSLAARMAGERGYMPLSTNLVPVPTLREHWKTYCEGAAEAGRPAPSRSLWRISRSVCVAEASREAWQIARSGTFAASFSYIVAILKAANMLNLMKHDPAVADCDVTPEYALEHLCIVGDPQECVRQLRSVWEETGGFGTLLMIAHDWDDKPRWLRSMELLRNEVIPALPAV